MRGQCSADLSGDAPVLGSGALLKRSGELVRDDCRKLPHSAPYRRSSLGSG